MTLNLFIPSALGLGPFVNTVCADSNEHERVCTSVSISRTRVCPEIVVNKTGKWGDCKNGFQDAIYNITIANHGSLNATGVKLLDTYPIGATFNSGQNPDWTDNGNGTLTYNHANMLIGSTSYVTLVLNFSNSAKLGPFNNTVYVYTNEYPKVSSSAILSRDSVCPVPGLEVTKTGQWEDCKNGFQDATYTIRINNKGNTAVTGVEVLDTYPISATFNSGQNPGWTNNGNGTLTYNHADIPSNTIVTVPLILNFSNSAGLGPFVNNVCVYTNELSRVCNSTSISRDQLCPVPEIEVTKTGQWGECKNGFQDATYTIKVYNKGTTTVTGVKLLDTYPIGATFNSGQNPNWTDNGNGTLTYNHADIPSNTIVTVPLILNFSNSAGLGPFVNNVCVYTNELSRVCNSTSISRDQLCPVPEIEVTKTGQWGECKNGFQDATYTIKVYNKGTTTVTGVKLLDTYPIGATFNSGQNPNWTDNGNGTLTYNHADIPSNTIVTVPLILNFSNSAGLGPFVNNVCVYTNELSRVCNSTSISRDQPCPTPGLEVNKTGEWTDCNCYVNYFINVTNLGDKDALVKFTDRYPEGAIIPTNENPGWLINGDGTLTYNYYQYHGIIPAGAKGDPVRLRLYLDKGLGFGPFNNTVWVDSNQYPRAYGYANITRSNFACVD